MNGQSGTLEESKIAINAQNPLGYVSQCQKEIHFFKQT